MDGKIMKSTSIIVIMLVSIFISACSNSTESDRKVNKLYVQISDANGWKIEGVGLHFYAQINPTFSIQNLNTHNLLITSSDTSVIPLEYKLYQNFPNPFNPQTTIMFSVPISGMATLRLLNIVDLTVVQTLVDRNLPAGVHSVLWDGKNDADEYVTNNIYSYQLQIEGFEDTKSLFLNMIDPEHIKSLNCVPLAYSNSDGKIDLDYKYFPIGEEVLRVDSNGNELGIFTIPDSLQLVFIKDNYQPKSSSVLIDMTKPLELSIILEN
jgi:hypothetical protein